MNSVPDNVALTLLEICPELALVNRRFYALSEFASRHRMLTQYNRFDSTHLVDALASDVHRFLGLDSWMATEFVSKFDFWFFAPENIVNLNAEDVTYVPSWQHLRRRGHVGEADDAASGGTWRVIEGMPWGTSLHAASVMYLHLNYATLLAPGWYRACINLCVSDLIRLIPIRFRVWGPNVEQIGSQFPSYGLGLHRPGRMKLHNCDNDYNVEMCMSALHVNGPGWAPVTFEIEDIGPFLHKDLMFNYLYFERISDPIDSSRACGNFAEWRLIPQRFEPRKEWRTLFSRLRDRKLSQQEQISVQ